VTKLVDISIGRYKLMRPRTLVVSVITTSTLIAMISVVTTSSEYNVNAQRIGDHSSFGNTTSGLQEPQQRIMINGTIKLEQTIAEAIRSKVNISLTQAMIIAEQSVGKNANALAAFGAEHSGYFAYRIILGTPEMEFYNVIVDPGNGQILATQEVSQKELEKLHLEHSAEVVRSGDGGSSGFPLLIPH
jgi:hypothetical protein